MLLKTPAPMWMRPNTQMIFRAILLMCGLVSGVLFAIEVGHRFGTHRRSRNPLAVQTVHPTIEASIFGLMGLLVSFTFYGAGSRFDTRRNLIAQEANAIGTAYLRLDLLPPEDQPELREDFRIYLRSRLDVYEKIPDSKAVIAALDRSSTLQRRIWAKAVEAAKESGPAEKSLVLAALNEMIDITTVRAVALITHPPPAVFGMLALTVIASSALAGYTMSASAVRDWVSTIALALILGIALYMILDYEYPRVGLIRIDPVDQVLVETLKEMK
jgi:CDP-diglyceride synthetase